MATSSEKVNLKIKNDIEKIRYDYNIKQGDFYKMILDTSKDVFETLFGDEIANIILNKLFNEYIHDNSNLRLENYLDRLDNYFGNDSVHISKMIEGKVLAKHHEMEMLKKIQLTLSED